MQMLLATLVAIPAFSAIAAAAEKSTAKAVVPVAYMALINGRDLAMSCPAHTRSYPPVAVPSDGKLNPPARSQR
jgi:hypothetical protein